MNNTKTAELLKIVQYYGLCPAMAKLFGEEFKLRIPYSEAVCNIPIEEMGLNVRPFNALRRDGVNTVGELIDVISSRNLFRIRCLDRKGAKEIRFTLAEFGFKKLSQEQKEAFILDMLKANGVEWDLGRMSGK